MCPSLAVFVQEDVELYGLTIGDICLIVSDCVCVSDQEEDAE